MRQNQHQNSVVRASILTAVVQKISEMDRSVQPIMNKMGLSASQLADPYGLIAMQQFVGFLEEAAIYLDNAFLGGHLGTELTASDLGPVGIILSLSASIDTGMERFVRYSNAFQGGTRSQWAVGPETQIFSYRLQDDQIWPRRHDAEFTLVSVAQVLRDNFQSRWSPQEVHFEHAAPKDISQLTRFFDCPILFQQSVNRIIMSADNCRLPVRKENTSLVTTLERHVLDLIGEISISQNLKQATQAVIEAHLGVTPVTLDYIARALNLTPRSLQRGLAKRQTSLRELVETTRKSRAKMLLSQPDIRINKVAESLGFGDTTAFWRAYRGWHGVAPSVGRERNLSSDLL